MSTQRNGTQSNSLTNRLKTITAELRAEFVRTPAADVGRHLGRWANRAADAIAAVGFALFESDPEDGSLRLVAASPEDLVSIEGTQGLTSLGQVSEVTPFHDIAELPKSVAERLGSFVNPAQPGIYFPLQFERQAVGVLLVVLPPADERSDNHRLPQDQLGAIAEFFGRAIFESREVRRAEFSQVRHEAIIESADDAIFTLQDFEVIDCNEGTVALFSASSREDLIGKTPVDLSPPTQPDGQPTEKKARETLAEIRRRGRMRFEWRHMRLDGTPFEAEVSASAYDYEGRQMLFAIVRDVTERRRAEEALRRSEQKYQGVFAASPDSITLSRMEDGVIIEANAGFERISGFTRAEAIGTSSLELGLWTNESDRERFVSALQRDGVVRGMEVTFSKKTGEPVTCLVSARPMKLDGKDHIVLNASEITELKAAQEALAEAEALLSAAIEQSPAGVLVAEAPDGRIRIANSAALAIRGADRDSLTDIPVGEHTERWQVFHPDGTAFAPEDLPLSQAVLYGKPTHNGEAIIRRADGSDRWVVANAAPVRDEAGNILAGVVVFHDITESRRAETMLKSLVSTTSATTGKRFFHSLVKHIAQGLDVLGVAVGEFVGDGRDTVRTLAYWHGKKIGANFDFAVAGSPCEAVAKHGMCKYLSNVRDEFSGSDLLERMGAESFLGMQLVDSKGEPLGLLALVHDRPLSEDLAADAEALMRISAARATAEMERMQAEVELRDINQQLLADRKKLTEKNITLQNILDHLEQERANYREEISTRVLNLVSPVLRKMRSGGKTPTESEIALLEDALSGVLHEGVDSFRENYAKLSSREAEIASHIRNGLTSKEIADRLGVSLLTVNKHREMIRRKLQIQNSSINLATYLRNKAREA